MIIVCYILFNYEFFPNNALLLNPTLLGGPSDDGLFEYAIGLAITAGAAFLIVDLVDDDEAFGAALVDALDFVAAGAAFDDFFGGGAFFALMGFFFGFSSSESKEPLSSDSASKSGSGSSSIDSSEPERSNSASEDIFVLSTSL